jgi:outer membrane protein TolC
LSFSIFIFLASCFFSLSVLSTEIFPLEKFISSALKKSPDLSRILEKIDNAYADALEIENLNNPNLEVNVNPLNNEFDNRVLEIEIEQPVRFSKFNERKSYANAMRKLADTEQKAKILEIIHSVTRGYIAFWILQEKEKLLKKYIDYVVNKKKLLEQASHDGIVDITDVILLEAESLRLLENLRFISTKKKLGASNLTRIAGVSKVSFVAVKPKAPEIPNFDYVIQLIDNEGSTRKILESRKLLAEKRYEVAKKDSKLFDFAPRFIFKQDFETNDLSLMLGVNISLPIWDRNNIELHRAIAERRSAINNLDALNARGFFNVISSLLEKIQQFKQSFDSYQEKIIPAWEEIQTITEKKFESGQVPIMDLFQMREKIDEVHKESLQRYISFIEAWLDLESLIGVSINNGIFSIEKEQKK